MTAIKQLNKKGGPNRWKFQSFSERIKEIQINITGNDIHTFEESEKNEPNFFSGLKRQRDLNITEEYVEFSKQIYPFCGSLSLMLYHKEKIIDILTEHLKNPDSLAIETILSLIPMLAKDLRQELEVFFPVLIKTLIPFTHSKDPCIVEAVFQSMAYLMKYLQKYVLKDFDTVYTMLSPLLGKGKKQKPFVRQFISEGLAYILRKIDPELLSLHLTTILNTLINESEQLWLDYADGISSLFANAINHINHTLHSFTFEFLRSLLKTALELSAPSRIDEVLKLTVEKIIHHVAKEKSNPLFTCFIEVFPLNPDRLSLYLLPAVRFYHGSKIYSRSELLDAIFTFQDTCLSTNNLKLIALLLTQSSNEDILRYERFIDIMHTKPLFSTSSDFFSFHKQLIMFGLPSYPSLFLPRAVKYISTSFTTILEAQLLLFLIDIRKSKNEFFSFPPTLFLDETHFTKFIVDPCVNLFENSEITPKNEILVISVLNLFPILHFPASVAHWALLSLLKKYEKNHILFGIALGTLLEHVSVPIDFEDIHAVLINMELSPSPLFLEAISLFLARFPSLSKDQKQAWSKKLVPFAGSFFHCTRKPVFSAMVQLHPESAAFQLCLELEQTENSLETIRSKGLLLKRLMGALNKEDDHHRRIICRYICSLLAVNFSTVWKYAQESLNDFADHYPTIFWEEVYSLVLSLQLQVQINPPSSLKFTYHHNEECMKCDEIDALTTIASLLVETYALLPEHADHWNIHSMLLQLLTGKPLTEKKTKQLVPLFLEFLALDYLPIHPELRFPGHVETLNLSSSSEAIQVREKSFGMASAMVEKTLHHFLEIFSHFSPANTYRSESLYQFYVELLASNDSKAQKLALACINTYAHPWFTPYTDLFSRLLNEKEFKDVILSINVSSSDSLTFDPHHRKEIMPLLLRLLFGQLRCRQKKYAQSKKIRVLTFLSSCNHEEIIFFFYLVLPFERVLETLDFNILDKIRPQSALRFSKLLEDLIKYLQLKMECILEPTLILLTSLACSISNKLEQISNQIDIDAPSSEKNNEDIVESKINEDNSLNIEFEDVNQNIQDESEFLSSSAPAPHLIQRMKKLRSQVIQRLIQIFNMDFTIQSSEYMRALYKYVVVPRLPHFALENTVRPTPLLLLLSSWFLKRDFALEGHLTPLLEVLVSTLSGSSLVRNHVLDILYKVLEQQPESLTPVTSALFQQFLKMIRHSSSSLGLRIFELVNELSTHLKPSDAPLMANVALETLNSKLSPKIKNTMLEILRPCIKHLDVSLIETIFFAITRLFAVLEVKESRLHLVSLTNELCAHLNLKHTGELCRSLNQLSPKRLDELDYDSVLNAFSMILDYKVEYTYLEWVPLLYNILFYLKSPDLSIRNSAYRCISLFIELSSTQEHLHPGIHQIIYPAIKLTLKNNKNDVARAEYVKVLHQCVRHLQEEPFSNLQVLLAKDISDESGFLDNIYHLQTHRRIRTVMRLRSYIHSISISNLKNVIFPILMHFLDHSDSNLAKECLLNFTEIASRLSWGAYYNFLLDFFARLSLARSKAATKLSIRAILAWLSGFHFELTQSKKKLSQKNLYSSSQTKKSKYLLASNTSRVKSNLLFRNRVLTKETLQKKAQRRVSQKSLKNQKLKSPKAYCVAKLTALSAEEKIIQAVTRQIIPQLMKYFISLRKEDDPSSKSLSVPIALGIAQLVSRLPLVQQQGQITKLLTRLCQLLRSRSKVMRYKARSTIIQIMKIVGSTYLHFLIKELHSALQRGFELHVLAYTVHKVMKYIPLRPSTIEKCSKALCAIVYNDIFGHVGQEKDAEAYIKTMVELKTCKSYEIIRIMAKHGSKKVLSELIETMKEIFTSNPDMRTLQKATKALKDISAGLTTNPLVTFEALIKLSYTMINKSDNVQQDPVSAASWEKHSHYFVDFGLQLLQECLFSKKLKPSDELHVKLIASMFEVLPPVFSSTYQPSIVSAGRVVEKMIRMHLPNSSEIVPGILNSIFKLLSKARDFRSDVSQVLLRVIHASLKHCETVPLDQSQIRCILEIIKPELGNEHHQTVYFSIIQAILKRKLLFHEIYEIASEISQIMVTSYSKNAQQLCRATYLQFLLDYPHTEKQLADHFAWMIKNLDYEEEKGRLSLLEFLQSLIKKLPESILNKYGQMLIAGLISKLVDHSPKCKELSAKILQNLLSIYSSIQKVHSMVNVWYKKQETMAIATQVHGILISIDKDDASLFNHLQNLLALGSPSESAPDPAKSAEERGASLATQWQILYFAILTFTKYVGKNYATHTINVPQILASHLLHPHHWIRLASSRCLGVYLTNIKQMDLDLTRHTITAMIKQLLSVHLDEALSNQVVKNLHQLFLQLLRHLLKPSTSFTSPYLTLRPIKHLSYLARRDQSSNKSTLFRTSIFKVFAAIIHEFPNEHLLPISVPIVAPIYRTIEDESTKGDEWNALRRFCKEILQLLESKLGPKQFGMIYSNVRTSTLNTKQARKQAMSELAVSQPDLHARLLFLKKETKKRQKKRKIAEEISRKISLSVKKARKNPVEIEERVE